MRKNTIMLWDELRKGNRQALVALYELFYQDLFHYGLRISLDREIAKDCIQEMFTQLWKTHQQLNPVLHVKAYLLKYLNHLVLGALKKSYRKRGLEELLTPQLELVANHEEYLIHSQSIHEQQQSLAKALDKLPERQKEIIRLRFFEGYDYEEISQITSLQYKTVYNTSHEAIKKLRKLMGVSSLSLILLLAATHSHAVQLRQVCGKQEQFERG
ncbi:RNA polymerase sigma factor [Rapidithrix thailandica]